MNNTNMKCRTCFFGSPTEDGTRHKCHISRPTKDGFPIVESYDCCAYWTDEQTRKQPLKPSLSMTSDSDENGDK